MDNQKSDNTETLQKLEQIINKISELVKVQQKVGAGYDYINASELAEFLGESIKTIYARVHNREIPFYKPGGKLLLFKVEEIQEWIKSGRHSSIDELRQNA